MGNWVAFRHGATPPKPPRLTVARSQVVDAGNHESSLSGCGGKGDLLGEAMIVLASVLVAEKPRRLTDRVMNRPRLPAQFAFGFRVVQRWQDVH